MAYLAALNKLPTPLKDLVNAASEHIPEFEGRSDAGKLEVVEWIEKVREGGVAKESSFQDLDAKLVPRTYLVSDHLSSADVALFGALHPVFSKLPPTQYYSHPSLTRYFDNIQSTPAVRTSSEKVSAFPLVLLELDKAPKLERKVVDLATKKKEKAAAKAAELASSTTSAVSAAVGAITSAASSTVAAVTGSEPAEGGKEKKKEKKQKEAATAGQDTNKKKGGPPAAAADESGEPVPSMIDLRVGHIVHVEKHPDADGLYVEQIDIGEETGPRTVVSGLVNYIPIEQMRDKYLVAVCNLKPANMRGVKSAAMVLCATSKDGKDGGIELIQPPPNSKPGDRVYFEGTEFETATPLSQLNPKKKIFEAIQPGFITLDSKEAAWVNPTTKSVHKIRTKEGVCVAPTLVGASLS